MASRSEPYTEHEKYADQSDDYLDRHNIYELFGSMIKKLVIHKPKDPLSFMITALEQPTDQLRVLIISPPHPTTTLLLSCLVRDFSLVRLRLSGLISSEYALGTPLGKQAQSYLDSGQELADQIAVPLLAARVGKADAQSKGWVLEGWPHTRAQALAMQAGGILPSHVLYFTNIPAAASSPSSSPSQSSSSSQSSTVAPPLDPVDAAALDMYTRNGASVQAVFSSCVSFLDLGSRDESALWSELQSILRSPAKSRAPRRPTRMFLLGPRGSGRHTTAHALATKYGLVHINALQLLRDEVARRPALGLEVAQYLRSDDGLLIPDAILSPLVVERILASDVRQRGFVLEGFPRTQGQVNALEKNAIAPNRVVILDCPPAEARVRIEGRRRDADTGNVYFVGNEDEKDSGIPQVIRQRLSQEFNDQSHVIDAINDAYHMHLQPIVEHYQRYARTFDSSGPAPSSSSSAAASATSIDRRRNERDLVEKIENFMGAPLSHQAAYRAAEEQKAMRSSS